MSKAQKGARLDQGQARRVLKRLTRCAPGGEVQRHINVGLFEVVLDLISAVDEQKKRK